MGSENKPTAPPNSCRHGVTRGMGCQACIDDIIARVPSIGRIMRQEEGARERDLKKRLDLARIIMACRPGETAEEAFQRAEGIIKETNEVGIKWFRNY